MAYRNAHVCTCTRAHVCSEAAHVVRLYVYSHVGTVVPYIAKRTRRDMLRSNTRVHPRAIAHVVHTRGVQVPDYTIASRTCRRPGKCWSSPTDVAFDEVI